MISMDFENSSALKERTLQACIGGVAMFDGCSSQKIIWSVKKENFQSCDSAQLSQSNQVIQCTKTKTTIINKKTRTSLNRASMFRMLVVLGVMLCRSPLLVDGLARADEKRNYLLSDGVATSVDEVVLQGVPYTVELERPKTRQMLQDDMLEEILSVKLKLYRGKASAFRVFVNLPDANEETPLTISEFSGLYVHEARRVKNPDFKFQVIIYRLGISDVIKELGLGDTSSLLVTFVPCGADKGLPVVLQRMEIESE